MGRNALCAVPPMGWNSWNTFTENINDSWNSIKDIALSQLDKQAFSGPYCHNDMDMLVVGMYGKGGNEYISAGGCTDEEYQTHFSLRRRRQRIGVL